MAGNGDSGDSGGVFRLGGYLAADCCGALTSRGWNRSFGRSRYGSCCRCGRGGNCGGVGGLRGSNREYGGGWSSSDSEYSSGS